jgi:hypothetical protein
LGRGEEKRPGKRQMFSKHSEKHFTKLLSPWLKMKFTKRTQTTAIKQEQAEIKRMDE